MRQRDDPGYHSAVATDVIIRAAADPGVHRQYGGRLMVASQPVRHSESWLLVRGDQSTAVTAGEHVLGRAIEADVRLDASGVSRRHARLVVYPGTAIITDLNSKNGTYVNRRRISGPT